MKKHPEIGYHIAESSVELILLLKEFYIIMNGGTAMVT